MSLIAFACYPLLLTVTLFVKLAHGDHGPGEPPVMDFHTFWRGGQDFLDGRSPYPDLGDLKTFSITTQQSFVYPAPMAAVFTPFALLPYPVAGAIYIALLTFSILGALWMLGVRDWRCYGIAFASSPVISGIHVGALSALLLLAVAAAWRFRRVAWLCGLAVAVAVVAKLFLWPLLLWLAVTRRWRALGWAVGIGSLAVIAAWARLGFAGLGSYPRILQRLSELDGPHTYQPAWILGGSAALVLEIAAIGLAVTYLRFGRRLDERGSLVAAVLLALTMSPIVWLHYFVLLIAVLAILTPRFSPAWLLLLAFGPTVHIDGLWKSCVGLAVTACLAGLTLRRQLFARPAVVSPTGRRRSLGPPTRSAETARPAV